MKLSITTDGTVRALYTESIDLRSIGDPTITRASHVEPCPHQPDLWYADLSPVQGPELGPYPTRGEALSAEADWLETHRI